MSKLIGKSPDNATSRLLALAGLLILSLSTASLARAESQTAQRDTAPMQLSHLLDICVQMNEGDWAKCASPEALEAMLSKASLEVRPKHKVVAEQSDSQSSNSGARRGVARSTNGPDF